jgi:hypothetical protein
LLQPDWHRWRAVARDGTRSTALYNLWNWKMARSGTRSTVLYNPLEMVIRQWRKNLQRGGTVGITIERRACHRVPTNRGFGPALSF